MHTPGNFPLSDGRTYHPANRPPSNPSNRTAKHSKFFASRLYGTSSALIGWRSASFIVLSQNDSKSLSDETHFAAKQIATGADEGLALLAEHEERPVGLMIAQPRYDQRTLEVVDLRIDYEHRRQGLATAMIYQAINLARERELRAVMVQTRTNNFPASQFLVKSAFDVCGIDTRRHSNHDM